MDSNVGIVLRKFTLTYDIFRYLDKVSLKINSVLFTARE